jgi:putative DNA primase/helicase
MTTPIDFDGINTAALRNGRSFVESLLPGGKFRSLEYVVKNPCRDDRRPGSFSINYRSGRWKDFASGDGGSDLVSLVAYLRGTGQGNAAREMADKLGVAMSKSITSSKLNSSGGNGTSHAAEAPNVYPWGNDGPPRRPNEIRRHVYKSSGCAMRVKIKLDNGNFVNWYRVPIGWQAKKPDDYQAIPNRSEALDPFDSELIADEILWPEGEKDVDSLSKLNLPAFTFGGVGDGLPDDIGRYLKDRRIVILADNDDPGRAHAEKKAAAAHKAGAASIKVVHFPELLPKGDVSDFIAQGGTAEQLIQRIDGASPWLPLPATRTKTGLALNSITAALVSRCAADIAPEKIEWLWPGRLARGKHTCIAGEPGTGKSQLSIAIIAAVTIGGEWPCGEGHAPLGNVIILSAEDGAADTIIPRLMAAGADRERVHVVSAVLDTDGNRRTLNLQHDLDLLEKKIAEVGDVALVIVDPVSSYLGKTDSHKNSEVRGVLEPLSEMADRTRVAILSITHFSKAGANSTTKALHRFIGSIAFTGAPRAAFAVIEDADQEGRLLLLHAKNNLAKAPQGLAYRIEQCLVGGGIVASRILWDTEPIAITANEALAADAAGAGRSARDEAAEWLQELLAKGPMAARDVQAQTEAAGLSWATVRRAKDRLGIKPERLSEGGDGAGKWVWALPSEGTKMLKKSQDAHVSDVSTLGQIEHLGSQERGR